MTSETPTGSIQWIAQNSAKVQSVIASVALYIGGIEAAHPSKDFWEVLTSGGQTGMLTIAAGVIGAAVAGWRTQQGPGRIGQSRLRKKARNEWIDNQIETEQNGDSA